MHKVRNSWRSFFASFENAPLSILLKYQDIDAQKYKSSLTKIETSYIVAVLNTTYCRLVDYIYKKCGYNAS